MRHSIAIACCTLIAGLSPSTLAEQPADLVIVNAKIWSDGLDGFATFAAVRDGRFVHVGGFAADMIGPDTQRVDVGGRVVIPGLIDSHLHMISGGLQLSRLGLRDATDKEDFIQRVVEWSQGLPEGMWVLGGRWSVESWTEPEQPTKEWVDSVTGDRPLYLPRMDGHSALVNSAALALAGITASGPDDPEGGVIDRDPKTGEPTGILRESAMGLVSRHIPSVDTEARVHALERAMDLALNHGITAVCDITSMGNLKVYENAINRDLITMRLFLYPVTADWAQAVETAKAFGGHPGWVRLNGFKAYIDGSLGSRTAYMREPFLNNEPGKENWRGLMREGVEAGLFAANAQTARDAGLQTIAHAIGDEANYFLLNTLELTYPDLPAVRARSEHAQHLLPEDIGRFAELGVIASMQPYHKADDGRYAEDYIGKERSRSSYAYRSLLDAGATVCFGSDWPVVTLNPFLGIEAAVTGRTLDGKLWQTQENISVENALRCYTSLAAYAAFAENEIGRIGPGYRADFVILNNSPFAESVDWGAIKPVAVYVQGVAAIEIAK